MALKGISADSECYIILYIPGMLGYTGKIFHTWILLGCIHKDHYENKIV